MTLRLRAGALVYFVLAVILAALAGAQSLPGPHPLDIDAIRKMAIEQVAKMERKANADMVQAYALSVENYALNEDRRRALGLPSEPPPVPPLVFKLTYHDSGPVAQVGPERHAVIEVPQPPKPVVVQPKLGIPVTGSPWFQVVAGDTSPPGTVITDPNHHGRYVRFDIPGIFGAVKLWKPVVE